ncbi:UNVERIFIED_CONTAM: hypothetical protein GTU68_031701, partial [Idotea baltica]|nr:hypothetical protein [Idotea baltica]
RACCCGLSGSDPGFRRPGKSLDRRLCCLSAPTPPPVRVAGSGLQYFVLGALSSAISSTGGALSYGATPGLSPAALTQQASNPVEDSSMILVGIAMILVGFGFKVSAVPFHMWTPDVYQGAPTPVVAFMASAVKVAGFAGMARVFWEGFGFYMDDWRPIIAFLAGISLIVGSFMALAQTNVKRMLAYSSIAHAGFMLAAVQAIAVDDLGDSALAGQALLFYMLAYTIMVAGTFGVMSLVGGRGDGSHTLDDYVGLSRSQPVLAGLMAVLLFSQAGIPFTSGFLAKFRVIFATAGSGSYVLAGVAMLSAVVAAVLYLRIVVSMFLIQGPAVAHAATDSTVDADASSDDGDAADADVASAGDTDVIVARPASDIAVSRSALAAIFIAAAATVFLGVLPGVGSGVLEAAAVALANLK